MAYSKIARALPTRPDIKELQYSGARFSRGAIAKLGQRLQSQYPIHKFQILLLYENWKPENSTRISKSKSDRCAILILSEGHYSFTLNPRRLHPSKLDRKQSLTLFIMKMGLIM
ncbi:hypothetical protein GLOIN_2v1793417 [Rhizophagus irregularis DAOM 181602=DAOM 197198]|nr:hypothetical protein GLOIN_2v1793417 [Rhizophagus irregularis DAOM 181602=DAOM 197198]